MLLPANNRLLLIISAIAVGLLVPGFAVFPGQAASAQTAPTASAASRPVGTVKSISGNNVTLTTDAGAEVVVAVTESTKLLRTTPGQTDLKQAAPIQISDIQVGDRMLAVGTASPDGKAVQARSVVVMKQTDVAAKQQREREDWQKRGIGGIVSAVDPATSTITVANAVSAAGKKITVHVTKDTIIRRYAPDSVRFDDAKQSTLTEIVAGDQLRARGARSADGSELTAEEIVSGSFRHVAGTVISVDASANTINVMDLATKKPVAVKVGADSQLRKLPEMMAQMIALRVKGPQAAGAAGQAGGRRGGMGRTSGATGNGMTRSAGSGNGMMRDANGSADFQQMLERMPQVAPAELKKGDAVMVVTTQGTDAGGATIITLLSGVEPILTASPEAAMLLSPWNLGGGGGGDAE